MCAPRNHVSLPGGGRVDVRQSGGARPRLPTIRIRRACYHEAGVPKSESQRNGAPLRSLSAFPPAPRESCSVLGGRVLGPVPQRPLGVTPLVPSSVFRGPALGARLAGHLMRNRACPPLAPHGPACRQTDLHCQRAAAGHTLPSMADTGSVPGGWARLNRVHGRSGGIETWDGGGGLARTPGVPRLHRVPYPTASSRSVPRGRRRCRGAPGCRPT